MKTLLGKVTVHGEGRLNSAAPHHFEACTIDEAEIAPRCRQHGGYRRSMELCQKQGLASVAFPAISTGIYRFPADRAAGIAVATVVDALAAAPHVTRVIFCCFSPDSGRLHEEAMAGFGAPCAD